MLANPPEPNTFKKFFSLVLNMTNSTRKVNNAVIVNYAKLNFLIALILYFVRVCYFSLLFALEKNKNKNRSNNKY